MASITTKIAKTTIATPATAIAGVRALEPSSASCSRLFAVSTGCSTAWMTSRAFSPSCVISLAPYPCRGGSRLRRREEQAEEICRVPPDAQRRLRASLLEPQRPRIRERREPAVPDQPLVDAAEPRRVRRVDRNAERGRLAVHRAAGRDDQVGQ